MAADDETGVDAVSTDGNPSADELEKRRASRGGSARERALEDEQAKLDAEDGNGGGEKQAPAEDDGQTFMFESDTKTTLGTFIPRGLTVERRTKFTGISRKGAGSIPAMNEDVLTVVRSRVSKVAAIPTRGDDEKAEKAATEVTLRPAVIHAANTEEALELLRPILVAAGWQPPAEQVSAAV